MSIIDALFSATSPIPPPVLTEAERGRQAAAAVYSGDRIGGCYRLDNGALPTVTEAINLARSPIAARVGRATTAGFVRPAGSSEVYTRLNIPAGDGAGLIPNTPCCIVITSGAARRLSLPVGTTDATTADITAEIIAQRDRQNTAANDLAIGATFPAQGASLPEGDDIGVRTILNAAGGAVAKAVAVAIDGASLIVSPSITAILASAMPVVIGAAVVLLVGGVIYVKVIK